MYDNDNRLVLMVSAGLGVLVAGGIAAAVIMRSDGSGAVSWSIPVVLVLVVVLALAAVMGLRQMRPGRVKRDWSGDPRKVIDQLVEDIDEEEARFLWRKINRAKRQELADSLDSYFSSREDDHQIDQP